MITLAVDNLTRADIQDKMKAIFSRRNGEKQELIPILQETQEQFRYLPAAAMKEIARFLRMPESTVYGVSTFYAQFKLTPLGRKIIRVCRKPWRVFSRASAHNSFPLLIGPVNKSAPFFIKIN